MNYNTLVYRTSIQKNCRYYFSVACAAVTAIAAIAAACSAAATAAAAITKTAGTGTSASATTRQTPACTIVNSYSMTAT